MKTAELAPTDLVQSIEQSYIDAVLEALDHPEALVTDESLVSDFRPFFVSEQGLQAWYDNISRKLGFEVVPDHTIVFLATYLKMREFSRG